MSALVAAYHVVLRHRDDGEQLCEWHGNQPWSYPQAREVLIGVERLWPRLHNAGVKYYLAAEPVYTPRQARMAALAEALLVS